MLLIQGQFSFFTQALLFLLLLFFFLFIHRLIRGNIAHYFINFYIATRAFLWLISLLQALLVIELPTFTEHELVIWVGHILTETFLFKFFREETIIICIIKLPKSIILALTVILVRGSYLTTKLSALSFSSYVKITYSCILSTWHLDLIFETIPSPSLSDLNTSFYPLNSFSSSWTSSDVR